MWSPSRTALALLGGSVLLRGLLWWLAADLEPLYDEADYARQAQALVSLAGDWSQEGLVAASGSLRWPPLQALLLSLGALVDGTAAMRAVVAAVSALTTPMVFLAARRLGVTERAALVAGLVHLLHPTLLSFSHLLWAETLLAALATGIVLVGTGQGRGSALGAGALTGLALLTKAAALPWLLVVPAWVGWRERRWQPAALCLGAALVLVAPWQSVVTGATGEADVLGRSSAVNLALGNHPDIRAIMGSSHGDADSIDLLEERITAEREAHGLTRAGAARRIALDEISAHPGAAAVRGARRLAEAWAPDWLPLRHHLLGLYGTPPWWSVVFWVLSWGTWAVVLSSAVAGLLREPRKLALPALMVGAAMAGPFLTVAMSRVHLPWVVLLLPASGLALSTLGEGKTRWALGVGLVVAAVVAAVTVRGVLTVHLGL